MNEFRRVFASAAVAAGLLLAAAGLAGCGRSGGPSEYEQMKAGEQQVAGTLEQQGAKIKPMHYPQGEAWAVDMTGMTITDGQIRQLKELGKVSELNLSKSTVTDDQLGQINDTGVGVVVLKLDLSNTKVTDAGLARMTNFKLLKDLNLTGTPVTADGVAKFKAARQSDPNINAMFKNTTVRR